MNKLRIKVWRFFAQHTSKKDIFRIIFAGFAVTVIFSILPFFSSCEDISNQVLRLHVIANSDSDEDQALKLKVRDTVLLESAKWYENAENFEEANAAVCMHLQSIERTAQETLSGLGAKDTVRVEVSDVYFETRDYEDFSLPAGKYRTLRVIIGEGKGKNWWCMVYPALCVPAAQPEKEMELPAGIHMNILQNKGGDLLPDKIENIGMTKPEEAEDLLSELSDEEQEIIKNPQKFVVQFKVVELFQKIKAMFDK